MAVGLEDDSTDANRSGSAWYTFHLQASQSASRGAESLRRFLAGDDAVREDLESQSRFTTSPELSETWALSEFFHLTRMQRLALFGMFFAAGILMSMLSMLLMPSIVLRPHKFALAFALGQVFLIGSTWFLIGPRAQLQAMASADRLVPCIVYWTSLALVIVASVRQAAPAAIVLVLVQIGAAGWYGLTYVPYGRTLLGVWLNPSSRWATLPTIWRSSGGA